MSKKCSRGLQELIGWFFKIDDTSFEYGRFPMLTLLAGQADLTNACQLAAVMQISDQLGDLGIKHVMLDKKIGSKGQFASFA